MVGSIILTLALLACITSVIMYFLNFRGYSNTLNIARISYHAMAILVIAGATLFLHAILTHQYQYKYVYDYSGSGLPKGLLISTFYAGQEGSFFLWTLFTAIVGIILQQYTSKRGDLEPRVMAVFGFALAFLLAMISPMLKNPFAYIWAQDNFLASANIQQSFLNMPWMQSFLFNDNSNGQTFVKMGPDLYKTLLASGVSIKDFIIQGKGLNPLLQNFWMQIHPPMLFVGFSMATVPFSFAISSLIKNEYKEWIKQSMPWILSGTMVLGLAIMLGGYWAYGVLGWGGYWGWDPVENSSFVPWLIGVASIHTILVQKKSIAKSEGVGEFAKTNLVLCILTYLLVLYSTFLTRSGILGDASVHSFTDPGYTVYLFLILFIGSFILLAGGMLLYRWKYLQTQTDPYKNLLNRELALFTGAVTLGASALIILVGTSAPIFGQAVDISFYSQLNLPLGIIIGLLNGFSLLLKWKYTDGKEIFRKSLFSLGAAVVLTILFVLVGEVSSLMMTILTFSSAFSLFVNIEIAYKIFRGKKVMMGPYIAHTGIAIFFLGVVGTAGFSDQKNLNLSKNKPVEAFGYTLTFTGYEPVDNGQKYRFHIQVKDGNSVSVVSPVMYFSEYNNGLMREPDIMTGFAQDFYIAPTSYDDGTKQAGGSEVALGKGESKDFDGVKITFTNFEFPKEAMNTMMAGGDFQIGAKLLVEYNGKQTEVQPLMKSSQGQRSFVPAEIKEANIKIDMLNLDASGKVNLSVSKLDGATQVAKVSEVLAIEASIKPLINLVWGGVLLTVLGFIVSVVRRTKESQV